MKFYAVQSTFIKEMENGPELQQAVKAHQQYLQAGFASGMLLFSGPKVGQRGGVIVMKAESLEEVEAFFAKDPMQVAGIQSYQIVEFALFNCQDAVRPWFS